MTEARVCPKCSTEKLIAEFGFRRVGSSVYARAYCRACERDRSRQMYKANPERCRESVRQSARKHPEKVKERYRKWLSENREWRKQYQVIRYWINPERERDRRRRAAFHLKSGYVNQLLGGSGEFRYPIEILEAKKLQIKINRLLKEKQ